MALWLVLFSLHQKLGKHKISSNSILLCRSFGLLFCYFLVFDIFLYILVKMSNCFLFDCTIKCMSCTACLFSVKCGHFEFCMQIFNSEVVGEFFAFYKYFVLGHLAFIKDKETKDVMHLI